MKHQFRVRLLKGDLLVGTMITLSSLEVTELLTAVGFDWLFIDAEHSPMSPHEIQGLLQAAGADTPCLIRLSSAGEVAVKKALDIGAAGIIVPQVNSASQAEQVVRWAKYSPLGTRGVGIGRAHGYGRSFQEYVSTANRNVTVVVQAEHIDAVNHIEAIVQVPGLDAVLIGPYDLSASIGKLGQVEDPEVRQAIEHVTQACQKVGLKLGIFGLSARAVQPYIESGYTLIVVGTDTVFLGSAASAVLGELRG